MTQKQTFSNFIQKKKIIIKLKENTNGKLKMLFNQNLATINLAIMKVCLKYDFCVFYNGN